MAENDNVLDDLQTVRLDTVEKTVYIGMSSVIGQRDEQQDAVLADDFYAYVDNGKAIAVLCDGMGGLTGGGKASNLCASIVYNMFHSETKFSSIPAFFRAAILDADDEVRMMKDEDGRPITGAGTTLASVVIDDNQLFWASVGDSRIYIIRNGDILCITKDHNYLMLLCEKVKRGELTQEEAESNPKKDALISYIGIGGPRFIDSNSKGLELVDGDCIVICSDGLYRSIKEDEIQHFVSEFQHETQQSAEALTNLAMSKGLKNQDNTSVIVICYQESV